LVENTAGAGGTICRSIEELATVHERLGRHPRLGLCLDSCHLYASGYDVTDPDVLDTVLAGVDGLIGLDRLRCLHVNDSQAPLGSNRDRHDAVPNGLMGERLGLLLAHRLLQKVPVVLETGSRGHSPSADDIVAARELHARWTSRRPAAPGRARGTRARRGEARRTRG
jgi:deoxyribonuclease-4